MDKITLKLLRMKHWQLFVVLVSPFVLNKLMGISYASDLICTYFFIIVLGLYIWGIIKHGNKLLSAKDRLKINLKRISLYGKIGIIETLMVYVLAYVNKVILVENENIFVVILLISATLPLFYFSFVIIKACAKTIVLIDKKETDQKLILTSVLILFIYIGIWGLQPKMNYMFNQKNYL